MAALYEPRMSELAACRVLQLSFRYRFDMSTGTERTMSLEHYWLFLPACFALNMTFGPNNALSISNGAREGIGRSITASLGRLLAFALMITIAGLGLGALLVASQTLFSILKFGGAAYLVWIGIKLLRTKQTATAAVPSEGEAAHDDRLMSTEGATSAAPARTWRRSALSPLVSSSRSMRSARASRSLRQLAKQEFLVAAGNPKAILFFTAFLPQFVDRSSYALSFTLIGATYLVLEMVAITIYAAIGARLGSVTTSARGFVWFNRVTGSMMIGFGILLAFLRRPAV